MAEPLLEVRDLKVSFRMGEGKRADAVRGVSFDVPENATVAPDANPVPATVTF